MPLDGNQNLGAFWDLVVEKVSKKLVYWKKQCISLGGRITLIDARMGNIPMYYMLVFKMPSKVVQVIEKYQREFYGRVAGKRTIW